MSTHISYSHQPLVKHINSVFFLQPDTVSSLEWWFCTRGSVGLKAPSVNCLSSSLPSNPRKRSSTSVTPQRLFTGLAKHNCICEREKKLQKGLFCGSAESRTKWDKWPRVTPALKVYKLGKLQVRGYKHERKQLLRDGEPLRLWVSVAEVRRRGQRFLTRQILYVDGEVRGVSELSQYASWEVQRDFVKQLKATNKLWKNWKQNRIFWIFGTFKIYCTTIYNECQ